MTANDMMASMMDCAAWPVAAARYPALDVADRMARWLAALDTLLARGEVFALVVALPGHQEQDESADDRKAAAQWFKDRREPMVRFCRGFVYILPDAQHRAALAARTEKMAAAFPVPLRVAADRGEAEAVARALLAAPHG